MQTASTDTCVSASEAIEMIHERSRHITTQIASIDHKMRTNATQVRKYMKINDKEQARLFMRRIRLLKEKRTRYFGVQEKLWAMKETLEEQSMYTSVQETFQSGVSTMDNLLKKVDITKIEDMMDTFQEQADDTREIGHSLSIPTNLDIDVENDIEAELNALMGQIPEVELPSVPSNLKVPKKEQHNKLAKAE